MTEITVRLPPDVVARICAQSTRTNLLIRHSTFRHSRVRLARRRTKSTKTGNNPACVRGRAKDRRVIQ